MRPTIIALGCCVAILGMPACDRAGDDSLPAQSAASEVVSADPAGDGVSMRYACEGGQRVAIIGEIARVTLADGPDVELRRVADQAPPRFSGEALEFQIDSDGAVLGQDEGGRFPCKEAD